VVSGAGAVAGVVGVVAGVLDWARAGAADVRQRATRASVEASRGRLVNMARADYCAGTLHESYAEKQVRKRAERKCGCSHIFSNGRVYLQSTYTNMLSCIAALFSRTTEPAREEPSCITRRDDRKSIPPALRHEGAPLTRQHRDPPNAPSRPTQTHF
jgi:hypothetical protein